MKLRRVREVYGMLRSDISVAEVGFSVYMQILVLNGPCNRL